MSEFDPKGYWSLRDIYGVVHFARSPADRLGSVACGYHLRHPAEEIQLMVGQPGAPLSGESCSDCAAILTGRAF